MDNLDVLTRLVEKLNLEDVNNIVEINFTVKVRQVTLWILKAHKRVKDNSILVDYKVAQDFALTCTQVDSYQEVNLIIVPVDKFIDCHSLLKIV